MVVGPTVDEPTSVAPGDHVKRSRLAWSLTAVALIVLGSSASAAGAWHVHQDANQRTTQAFSTSAMQIASRLQLAI